MVFKHCLQTRGFLSLILASVSQRRFITPNGEHSATMNAHPLKNFLCRCVLAQSKRPLHIIRNCCLMLLERTYFLAYSWLCHTHVSASVVIILTLNRARFRCYTRFWQSHYQILRAPPIYGSADCVSLVPM